MTRFDLQEFIPVIKMKNADKLSKGQEQRIIVMNLILDIMYNNKRILFLDEFTSNVDAKNEQVIFQELKTLQNMYNLTIFYISHNSSNIVYSDYNYLVNPDTLSISKQVTNK
jgi:ABC-type bacteriocin/lantibiotic exporter with double-glycine peptidase domain